MIVPVYGQISAGKPFEPIPMYKQREIRPITNGDFKKEYAAVQVSGDSLIENGIYDGDYAIYEVTHEARNGDLVCALIQGENAIKYLVVIGEKTVLRSANAKYEDLVYDSEEVTIQGVVKRIERDI